MSYDEAAASDRVFKAVRRQIDLAKKLGLTSSAISNLKKRQKCTLPLIIAASELTGKPVEWFLFGDRGNRTRLAKRARELGDALSDAGRESARLADKFLVAERETRYQNSEDLQALFGLFQKRLAALESWARILELRVADLERETPPTNR